jgi:hypothetical protein
MSNKAIRDMLGLKEDYLLEKLHQKMFIIRVELKDEEGEVYTEEHVLEKHSSIDCDGCE